MRPTKKTERNAESVYWFSCPGLFIGREKEAHLLRMNFNGAKILFISLIPHLKSEKGHYYAYHRSLEKVVEFLGISFSCYVSEKCEIDLPKNWTRYFPSKKLPLKKVTNALFRFHKYLKLFSKSSKNEKRIVFLECFREIELCLIATAFAVVGKKRDSLWLLYRYDLNTYRCQGKIILVVTKLLRQIVKKRLQLFTDSELISEQLQSVLKERVYLAPIPHIDTLPTLKKDKQGICLWWPGEPRKPKGFFEIQKILSFKNQTKNRFSLMASKGAKLVSSSFDIDFVQLKETLTRAEYLEAMQKSDIVLLPYSSEIYVVSTSGIFVEAVTLGKIPLVKEGTWLTHELKRHGLNELIIDWDDSSFFTKVSKVYEDTQILERLKQMQSAYKKFHSKEAYAQVVHRVIQESFS